MNAELFQKLRGRAELRRKLTALEGSRLVAAFRADGVSLAELAVLTLRRFNKPPQSCTWGEWQILILELDAKRGGP